jgi:hypothetical protein
VVHRAPKLIVSSSQNTPQGLLMTPWAVWRLGGLVLVSSDFCPFWVSNPGPLASDRF